MRPPTNEVRVALAGQKPPSVAGCASMPAGATSRYALGAGGVGAARPRRLRQACAPSRATRSALGARRCAPVCRAAQPLASIAASRYALGADGMGALRARAPAAARSRPRAARSATMAWAPRARAPACAPPDHARVASWWWGGRRRRALCADRDAWCKARFALAAEGDREGGKGCLRHHHARACGATLACYRSMCAVRVGAACASATGAPYPQRPGQPPAL